MHLKLNQPKVLEESGVTSVSFKPWRNHVLNFLKQDDANFNFLPGEDGSYKEWTAAAESPGGKRIVRLTNAERDKINLPEGDDEEKREKLAKLLRTRNGQLAKMIQHVVSFCHYTEQDDIDKNSTSMEWIFSYLERHYNIEARGANFLNITNHTFANGTNPQVFYKQFRADFLNNLRKTGDKMEHKGPGKTLAEDEVLSPSFEDAIILWSLEKIDARLPKKVKKDYEHRLDNATYLIDIQATVFQAIPAMLEDMEKEAGLNAMAADFSKDKGDVSFNASYVNDRRGGRAGRGRAGGGRGRARGGGTGSRRPWTEKFCRVCHSAGKRDTVYAAHNTSECPYFGDVERKNLYYELGAMGLGDEDDDEGDGGYEEEHQEEVNGSS